MSERPILFSGPMVRALLDGRKTQTRRVVKPQPDAALGDLPGAAWNAGFVNVSCPYGAPGDTLWARETWGPFEGGFIYRADEGPNVKPDDGRWHPSIHMPRWASRLTLHIKSVRVERLQEISEADALAEGCTAKLAEEAPALDEARQDFRELWESINGPGSWDANPWVWVVEFKRVQP